ncbi:unnamed protein product [Plutella xylostella]|uniref:(diamondback moth) hypothetical protein n=1 Tax=Plutella xylostella TaxID=51655 RepID=A0A8S4D2M5_PLUXY|nr:unnamed protein product [Plutella xylostella]
MSQEDNNIRIVNRGDSFRRRRSRSGSLAPSSPAQAAPEPHERKPVALYRVAMVGAPGVGKTALISQFQTSECINAYDRQRGRALYTLGASTPSVLSDLASLLAGVHRRWRCLVFML